MIVMRCCIIVALSCSPISGGWAAGAGIEVSSAAAPLPAAPPHILGPEKFSEGMQEIVNELDEERDHGYIAVSEENVDMYSIAELSQLFSNPSEITARSRIKYHFSGAQMRHSFAGMFGISLPDRTGYSSVVRVYSLAEGTTATLEELDYESAGVTIMQVKSMVNADVNGIPGTITYRRSPSNKGLVLVSWITPSRFLKLALAGSDVRPEHRHVALELARSVRAE